MILWHFVLLCILMGLFKDTAGTVCSEAVTDGTPVLNMCEAGNVDGRQVVIDTYGSSAFRTNGGSINCSCTATLTGLPEGTSTTVAYGSVRSSFHPSFGCGSSLNVSAQLAAFGGNYSSFRYLCIIINNTFNLVKTNDTLGVIWESGPSGSTSGYCLSVSAGPGASLSTKCNSHGTTPSSPTPTTSTTTTTSTTLMTSLMTTTSTTTTTTTTVIIGIAAGGVVFLVICIVIAVMCSRTKKKPNEHREPASAVANVFYEATRVPPPEAVTNHVLTPSGDIYAQINKNSKVETNNSKGQPHEPEQEVEHVTTSSGDMYAQVEKHSKVQITNSAEKSREPEQEIEHITTPSGDIYAQISKDGNDESN